MSRGFFCDLRGASVVLIVLTASAVGCPGDGGEGSTPGSETTAVVDPTVADGASTGSASTSEGGSTAAAVTDSGSMDDATTQSDTMPMSETGVMPPVPKSCALEVMDPSADPAAVIDAGDAVGQIPTSVGDALLRNCGCHYTDDVPIGRYVDYISNNQPMSTLADFHGNFMGTFPVDFERMPTYEAVEERVVFSNPLPMPPFGCGVEGEPGRILEADLQLLTDWLAAGAPDGASFP